jgi:hypothetical protein
MVRAIEHSVLAIGIATEIRRLFGSGQRVV